MVKNEVVEEVGDKVGDIDYKIAAMDKQDIIDNWDMFEDHSGMVYRNAAQEAIDHRRVENGAFEYEEIYNEARVGLYKAAIKYRYVKASFNTYAYRCVRGYLNHFFISASALSQEDIKKGRFYDFVDYNDEYLGEDLIWGDGDIISDQQYEVDEEVEERALNAVDYIDEKAMDKSIDYDFSHDDQEAKVIKAKKGGQKRENSIWDNMDILIDIVDAGADCLNDNQVDVMHEVHAEGKGFYKIGRDRGVDESAIRGAHGRALKNLKANLGDYEDYFMR